MKIIYKIKRFEDPTWSKNIIYYWIDANGLTLDRGDIRAINFRTGNLMALAWKQAEHLRIHPRDNPKHLQKTLRQIHRILKEYCHEGEEPSQWFEHFNAYYPNLCYVMNKNFLLIYISMINLHLHATAPTRIYNNRQK